ncbi:MAG TPA: hypothetical protein VJA21_06285 [Verrucomicrobiae bacterium]
MPIRPSREDIYKVTELVSCSACADEALIRLVKYFRSRGLDLANELRQVDIECAVSEVRDQLTLLFKSEPLPREVGFIYFGLFDLRLDEGSGSHVGFYICGGYAFDRADSDSLCNPCYFPEDRSVSSGLLDLIKVMAITRPSGRDFLEYTVMLAAAALLVRFGLPSLGRPCKLIVGFDDGDYIEL